VPTPKVTVPPVQKPIIGSKPPAVVPPKRDSGEAKPASTKSFGEARWSDDPAKSISSADFEKQHKAYIESVDAFVNQEVKNKLSSLDASFSKQFFGKSKADVYREIADKAREEEKYQKPEFKDDLLAKTLFAAMKEKGVDASELLMALEYLMKKEMGEKDFQIFYKKSGK
jgi:hypothetical protein